MQIVNHLGIALDVGANQAAQELIVARGVVPKVARPAVVIHHLHLYN